MQEYFGNWNQNKLKEDTNLYTSSKRQGSNEKRASRKKEEKRRKSTHKHTHAKVTYVEDCIEHRQRQTLTLVQFASRLACIISCVCVCCILINLMRININQRTYCVCISYPNNAASTKGFCQISLRFLSFGLKLIQLYI